MFKFTQLKILHSDMKRKDEERAIFTFTYNKKHNGKIFSCIFLTDIIPYRLYLSAVGGSYLSFEFTLNENYEVETYLDNEKYRELVNFLGIKYDKDHIFKPIDFFEVLNKKIPTKFKERPSYNRVISLNTEKKVEDPNKPYFCGWRRSPSGNVTNENLEKTRIAFGDKYAKLSKEYGISSCWTEDNTKENLKMLSEIIGRY